MGSHGAESKSDQSDLDDALQPVALPAPKPKAGKTGERVDASHAPTVDEVLDPKRPDMEGASQVDLADSISDTVDKIYNNVLIPRLEETKSLLAEIPPPPDSSLAGAIIGEIVEGIAIAAIGVLGKLAVDAIKDHVGSSVSGSALDGIKVVARDAGSAAKDAAKQSQRSQQTRAVPGADLLTEFVERERLLLLAKQHDATIALRMVRASAARAMPGELANLDSALRSLLDHTQLGGWFMHRMTMEWLNFCARLALGERKPGQHTDVLGANEKGGVARGGRAAQFAWRAATDGFISITIEMGGGGDGAVELQFIGASVNSGPGARGILENASSERDVHGAPYTLATLPLYRRISINAGDSRLDEHAAFVITPEGAIEANFDDPDLTRIGAGDPMAGARTVARLLATVDSGALR